VQMPEKMTPESTADYTHANLLRRWLAYI